MKSATSIVDRCMMVESNTVHIEVVEEESKYDEEISNI